MATDNQAWSKGIPSRDGRYLWRSKECDAGEIELISNQRYVAHPNLVSIESSEAFKNGEFKYIGPLRDSMNNPTAQPAAVDKAPPRVWIVSVVMVRYTPNRVNTQNKLYEITASETAEGRGKARELAASDFPEHYVHTVCQIEVTRAQAAGMEALEKALQTISELDDCGCDHSTDDCCAKVDYPCGKCIAATALAAVEQLKEKA